jgi:hypothetical protein
MRSAVRRLSRVLLAATIVASAMVMGAVAPAHAYTCGYNDASGDLRHSEVRVTFRFEAECTDGLARVTGTIYDTLCDGRAARSDILLFDTNSTYQWLWTKTVVAGNGCGSNATYTVSGKTAGQYGWHLQFRMTACSAGGWNCASTYWHDFYG